MPIRFQTSIRLSSLPSLINTNYWMPSRMMMTSNGRQREPWDARWDHCHDRILRFTMAQGTTEESLQKVYRNLMYIGLVPVVPMVIEIDWAKWEVPRNHLPHFTEKQTAIRMQIQKLLGQALPRWIAIQSGRVTDVVQFNVATRGLAYSKHYNETHMLWSHRLHSRVSSNSSRPGVTSQSISMDTGCHETERSWSLPSSQHAEQGPSWLCLRHLWNTHRCIHGRTAPEFLNPWLKPIHLTRELFPRSWPTWWNPFELWYFLAITRGPTSSSGQQMASPIPRFFSRNITSWKAINTSSWKLTKLTWPILPFYWLGRWSEGTFIYRIKISTCAMFP